MPETNPRLGRTFRSKIEQKGIIERGQGSGKVSCKETCPLGGHREAGCGEAWLERSTWREKAEQKSMEGLRCPLENLGLICQAVGSYQGCKQLAWPIRLSKVRTRQKGQAGGQGPRQDDGNYTSQAGNNEAGLAEGGWGGVARS